MIFFFHITDIQRHPNGNIRTPTILDPGRQLIILSRSGAGNVTPTQPDLVNFLLRLDWGEVFAFIKAWHRVAFENIEDAPTAACTVLNRAFRLAIWQYPISCQSLKRLRRYFHHACWLKQRGFGGACGIA